MKKGIIILTCLLAASVFAACSGDDAPAVGDVPAEGTPTLALAMITQRGGTYSSPDAHIPDADEKKIHTATLWVFDAGGQLEQSVALDPDSGTAYALFETTTGAKYLYATVNIPESVVPVSTQGLTRSAFENAVVQNARIETLTDSDEGFWMTNTASPSPVFVSHATRPEVVAGRNNFVVPVGRASGKVALDFTPSVTGEGTLTDVEYSVRNLPLSIYLMPSFSQSVMHTPMFAHTVVDAGSYHHPAPWAKAGEKSDACSDYLYINENGNSVPKAGNSTYVLIKGVFTPSSWCDSSGIPLPAPAPTGDTFWRIANYEADGYISSYEPRYFADPPDPSLLGPSQKAMQYTAGECYYRLYIKDSAAGEPVGRYAQPRNHFYWITVTALSGAGAPGEEDAGMDPETPLDMEEVIEADLLILDWEPVDIDIDLKGL